MNEPLQPKEPLKIAVIGTGFRSTNIYTPLYSSLKPWVEVVAVCDPVKENADKMAARLNVPAYYDIRKLVADRPMEAAIVITPVESHHSISVYLSSHGIHNLTETTWCSLFVQAKDMIDVAAKHNVVIRVAENFFHFPIDRFSHVVRDSGIIGRIGRIFSYNDHTGYHNNSRWIVFAGGHPEWVQSIDHAMATAEFHSTPQRFHNRENYHARFYKFANDFMVIDQCSNAKGFLGRMSRPGLTEWQGERGTLVHQSTASTWGKPTYYEDGKQEVRQMPKWPRKTELRVMNQEGTKFNSLDLPGGYANEISAVVDEIENRTWLRSYAETSRGTLEYVNPYRPLEPSVHFLDEYGSAIMAHIIDFALAVKGLRKSIFDEHDAMMSLMMEIGARESALHEGKRVALPLDGDLEADRLMRAGIRSKLGVDPLDVEGMLSISYPKP